MATVSPTSLNYAISFLRCRTNGTSWRQIYNEAKGSFTGLGTGATLYSLWQEITANVSDGGALDRLARLFEAQYVTPQPDLSNAHTVVTTAGATFDFWLPLTSSSVARPPFTFTSVTLELYDPSGTALPFIQTFVLSTVTVVDGGGVSHLSRPTGRLDQDNLLAIGPGGVQAATREHGARGWRFHGRFPKTSGTLRSRT